MENKQQSSCETVCIFVCFVVSLSAIVHEYRQRKFSVSETNQNSASPSKRDGMLRVYAAIVAAGALLLSCISLFGGIYGIIGMLWPWLGLGRPEMLLRGLVRAAIALPIAMAVFAVHYRLLKQHSS